jgi:tetratricopeptide (TPR) repeat protein
MSRRRSHPILGRAVLVAALVLPRATTVEAGSPGQAALDRGTALYKEGRFAEAIVAFEEATRLDPGLLQAWENRGWAYHRTGQTRKAIETWTTVLKVDPARVDLLNEMGAIQLAHGRYAEAVQAFERSLRTSSQQPDIYGRLAEALDRMGRSGEAEARYREVVRLRPSSLTAALRLAEFQRRHGREEAALATLRQARSRLGPYRHILELRIGRLIAARGDRAYQAGDFQAAVVAFQEAVRSDPRNAQYLINLGWAQRRLGEGAEAAKAWKQALLADPARSSLYRHIADVALEQDDLTEAAAMYGRAWEGDDRQPAVPFRLAEIALDEGRLDDARQWLGQLFALPSADAEWSRSVAAVFVRVDQPAAGIALFESRLPSSGRPEETRRALSRLFAYQGGSRYRAGEMEAAMRALEEAVRLDPVNPSALRDLGWTYVSTGHLEHAARIWQRYAKAYPDEPQPRNLLTHVNLKRKDYAAAVESAQASLRLDPGQLPQQLNLARALLNNGQFTEARDLAERLARENADDLAAQVLWGELLMQYHDFARGKAQWRRVLDLGSTSPKAVYYWILSMYELGEYEPALAEAARRVDAGTASHSLVQLLADDALRRQDAPEAIRWYQVMATRFPERLAAWLELARLQGEVGDLAAAQRSLQEARRRHPDRVDVVIALAELDRRAGRVEESRVTFASLSQTRKQNREVFQGAIESALAADQPAEALGILRAGPAGLMKGYEARLQESRILFDLGRPGDAQQPLARITDPPRGTVYVPILMYHGIGDHPRSASVPVTLFDSQMKALRAQGWTALTVTDLARMVAGKQPFPRRPILITFDDARIDSFERADPVLARHGLKATMFVPTARILDGHPFFADWARIRSFASSGRWDLQSHGHHAHDPIPLDAAGQTGSFLVNRQWREDGRLETTAEYAARLEADYLRSIEELTGRFPRQEVVGYAFPFSEAGQEGVGNEPTAAEVNQDLLARHFRFGFIQDESGYNELQPGTPPPPMLRRFGVPRDYDGEKLLAHLAAQHPGALALAQSARMHYWMAGYDRSRQAWERLAAEQPAAKGEAAYYLAAISYQQGRYGAASRHLRTAENLQSPRLQADPALAQRIRWESRGRVESRAELTSDSATRETRWAGIGVRPPSLGPLELGFGYGMVSLREEDFVPLDGHEFSVSARVAPVAHWALNGRAWQQRFDGVPDDRLSFRAGMEFETDWLELRFHGGEQEIDTLQARQRGIRQESYSAQAGLRLSPTVRGAFAWAFGRFDDRNERRDLTGRLVFQPRWGRGLGFGAAAGWSDTRFISDAYYSPDDVRWARGLLSYRRQWGAGWMIEGEVGLGMAVDDPNGRRRTLHAAGRAGQAWGEGFRTFLEGSYSDAPGYDAWGLGGAFQVRF